MSFNRAFLLFLILSGQALAADGLAWMEGVLPPDEPVVTEPKAPENLPVSALPKVEKGLGIISGGPASKPVTSAGVVKSEVVADNQNAPALLAKRGLLNDKNGGFSSGLWLNMNRAYADKVLEKIQQSGLQSYHGHRLLQRMLLTAAEPPEGESQNNWLAVRINTLHALGMADAGRALLRGLTKPETLPSDVARVWVESNLMTGDSKRACQYVKQQVLNTDDPFWRQAVMVCQVIQGDKEGLRLSLDAAAEGVKAADPTLVQLLRIAQSDKGIVPDIKTAVLEPLQALVARHTALLLNEKTALKLPDALQREVVKDSNLSLVLRTQVAEHLVVDYGLEEDLKALTALYDQFGFTESDLQNAKLVAEGQASAVSARALLWQASDKPELDTDRALLLQALWDRAAVDGLPMLAVSLAPGLRRIQPTPALAWFAPEVISAQLMAGRLSAAEPWWRVLNENQSLSKELLTKRAALNLVFGVVNATLKPEDLRTWWEAQNLTNKTVQNYVLKVLTLVESMGQAVPTDMWQTLHTKLNDAQGEVGRSPGGLWLRMVSTSLDAGHTGESMLLLLEPLQSTSIAALAPMAMGNVVTGFKFMNMMTEAKAFALEALLGQGSHP